MPGVCLAAWYQTTGVAKIHQGDKTSARKKAVDEAIKEALLFSGASISSIQQVRNGLLTQDLFMVRSSGVVNDIEILSEDWSNSSVNVTIRADIFADERQCMTAAYRKSLAVIPFVISHQAQAQIGGIYQLGNKVSETLYQALTNQSSSLDVRDYYQSPMKFANVQQNITGQLNRAMLDNLAQHSDVQYILTGRLTDLSIEYNDNKMTNWLTGEQAHRYFDMQIELYDAYRGEKVNTFTYQTDASWSFDTKQTVDINSRRFWQSEYGAAINSQLDKSLNEIEASMRCKSANAKVIDVADNQLRFNLGSQNGVKAGDKFKVLHQASFTDRQGKVRPNFIVSHYEVEVTQVYAHSALAQTKNNQRLENIQVGDLISSNLF
ncbi:flagellar assembly protein FlgT [Catenovulum sp. 2E275]|uniref:flagella assembly protein FlgT n=1 Tax=Catenovulum sp. 2E275 TaxID=2980497 RepID=UPI0021D0A2D2|nr:flagella assembly protein FlgT [Catenovulum sp. 2E275]MCU4676446.1 flagellar assembly protein FlgT [Catenovulum sp. 2E275]